MYCNVLLHSQGVKPPPGHCPAMLKGSFIAFRWKRPEVLINKLTLWPGALSYCCKCPTHAAPLILSLLASWPVRLSKGAACHWPSQCNCVHVRLGCGSRIWLHSSFVH